MNPEIRMSKAYTDLGGKDAMAMPWAEIIALIMSLMGGGCTVKQAKRRARMFPQAFQGLIEDHLKDKIASVKTRKLVAAAAHEAFTSATDQEIEDLRDI